MAKQRLSGEGNIRLRPDGRYEVRISGGVDYATGEQVRISRYAKTEEEAVQTLHKLSFMVGSNQKLYRQTMTLGEWMDIWLDVYMKNILKQSTFVSYEGYARKHYKPALGQVRLSELVPQVLQQFYNYKVEVEGLSPKTIVNMNLCLHKCLDQAVKENLIVSNPASCLNLPRLKRADIEILTRDEQAVLMRASYQHRYGVFVRLVLATGLRLGELLGLKWEDIDFRRNMLYVKRSLNRLPIPGLPANYTGPKTEIVIQEPKTPNSARSIPLHNGIMADLMQWKQIQDAERQASGDGYVDTGMIVTNPTGGYVEPRTFSDQYHKILELAGLRHFTFHALRHTFASRAMEQGMDFKTLSVLLGHSSVAFTMDTYAHVLDDKKREAMQCMEELYTLDQTVPSQQIYPILFTPGEGGYMVSAPDFPLVRFYTPTMEEGIAQAKEEIRAALVGMVYPPLPSQLGGRAMIPGEFEMQIAV